MGVDDSLGIKGPAGEHHVAFWVKVHLNIYLVTAPDMLDVVLHAHDGNATVIIEFTDVTFVGAAGINLLVDARDRLRVTGDDLLVRSPAPPLTRMLVFFGLTDMIESAGVSDTTHACGVQGPVTASRANNPFAASAVLIEFGASRYHRAVGLRSLHATARHLCDNSTCDSDQCLCFGRGGIADQGGSLLHAALLKNHQHALSHGDIGVLIGQPLGDHRETLAAGQQGRLGHRHADLRGQDGPEVLGSGVEGRRLPRVEVEATYRPTEGNNGQKRANSVPRCERRGPVKRGNRSSVGISATWIGRLSLAAVRHGPSPISY